MAGEKKGEMFEVLVFLALERLGYKPNEDFYWGEKPKGFSIDPDFIMGPLDNPTHWLLVTTTKSAKNTPEKFWRNLGELFEVKRTFIPAPKIVNIVFESNQMEVLQDAMATLSDTNLLVDKKSFGADLIKYCLSHLNSVPSKKNEKVKCLSTIISKDSTASLNFSLFANEIKSILGLANSTFSSLWEELYQENRGGLSRSARKTYVRRGIAKLIILPKEIRDQLYQTKGKRLSVKSLPSYVINLGFFQKSLLGYILSDFDIKETISLLDDHIIEGVVSRSYIDRKSNWDKWIAQIKSFENSFQVDYIRENYEELITPSGMLNHLNNHSPDSSKWLFWLLIELLKIKTKKKQGYGFSVLAQDVGYAKGISQGYKYLADWANGALKQSLPTNLIPDVSRALSLRLKEIDFGELEILLMALKKSSLDNLIEQKLVAYCVFEPLPIIVEEYLRIYNKSYTRIKQSTFIGEYLRKPKHVTTPVIRVGSNLIHWKSAFDKGRHHKTKELSGRAEALRFEYTNGIVGRRHDTDRLILVIDGTFTQEQIQSLYYSGWDMVLYLDEIENFVKLL